MWNGFAPSFALMLWVNHLHVRMDVVSEKAHQKKIDLGPRKRVNLSVVASATSRPRVKRFQ